eukprot:924230-Prorocentrum_minimum.AAC.21
MFNGILEEKQEETTSRQNASRGKMSSWTTTIRGGEIDPTHSVHRTKFTIALFSWVDFSSHLPTREV